MTEEAEFIGTDRFVLERELGSGAFGLVYQVFDREQNMHVALKALRDADPQTIYHLKQEFRSLAGVLHPNLIKLYELMSDGSQWFFTMELVDGVDFYDHLRSGLDDHGPVDHSAPTMAAESTSLDPDLFGYDAEVAAPDHRMLLDEAQLREALGQLVKGVDALHQAGKLHRDLKPSNVLVEAGERVVILDFGLVTERRGPVSTEGTGMIVGTPEYMSPEQAMGQPLGEASDWYSVGVILFELLCGRLPFVGPVRELLQLKVMHDPPEPGALVPGIPEDLSQLCFDLLQRDPASRPSGYEIRKRLGIGRGQEITSIHRETALTEHTHIVGRRDELRQLQRAHQAAGQGHTVVCHISGASGMGKSALVHHFLDQIGRMTDTVILQGRCYQQENVPYKALDSLVDSLRGHLQSLPDDVLKRVIPKNILELTTLFPVLQGVRFIRKALKQEHQARDPIEIRRLGFRAFRLLIKKLCQIRPLILVLDDLQWGDIDSAALLIELFRPPDPPALLTLFVYRSSDAEFVTALPRNPGPVRMLDLRIGPLDFEGAKHLAALLLGTRSGAMVNRSEVIARESAGSPLLVSELVQYSKEQSIRDPNRSVTLRLSLDELLKQRLDELPDHAKQLLEVLAIAGRPLPLGEAKRVAGIEKGGVRTLMVLRNNRLVRSDGMRADDRIQTYHDRIEEAVLSQIDAQRLRRIHMELALFLEGRGSTDNEALARHYQRAGVADKAADYVFRAAEEAASTLAFNRAANFYETALELGQHTHSEKKKLQVKLAGMLVKSGRGNDAGQAYLGAAALSTGAERLGLQREAAGQFLLSGRTDMGITTFQRVLETFKMELAETPKQAVKSMRWRGMKLKLRGLSFSREPEMRVKPDLLQRIDACWSIAIGLMMVDPIRGAEFQSQHIALALQAGEPYRVTRAYAAEAIYRALLGAGGAQKLVEKSIALAKTVKHTHGLAFAHLAKGIVRYLEGDFGPARDDLKHAEELLRDGCIGVTWELDTAQIFSLWCWYWLGEWTSLLQNLPLVLTEADERGDLYVATNVRCGVFYAYWLSLDQPARAHREIDEAIGAWSSEQRHLQHSLALIARTELDLYADKRHDAWDRLDAEWEQIEATLLFKLQYFRIRLVELRARCALAHAIAAKKTEDPFRPETKKDTQLWLSRAEPHIKSLSNEKTQRARPLAQLLRAGVAWINGNKDEAAKQAAGAEAGFGKGRMGLHNAATQHRRGEMLGGTRGRSLLDRSLKWFSSQNLSSPGPLIRMITPWF